MVELMDRSIASVAVCPVFIVHFKLHIEKCYLQSGMDTIIHNLIWTLLFYSRLKHSEVIHCVAAPRRNSHWKWLAWQDVTSQTSAQRDCVLYLWTWVCVVEMGKGCIWHSSASQAGDSVQNKRSVCRGCADQRSSSTGIKTLTQSLLTSVWKRSPFEYLFFTPPKTHKKLTYFGSVVFTPLDAYSSFLILRNVYFIVFVEGKNVAICFHFFLCFIQWTLEM